MAKALPLRIRKLADTSSGERVKRYHPETGEAYLADPSSWRADDPSTHVASPWPFAGIRVEGDAPKASRIPTSFVDRGIAEGWLELEGSRVVHRPGGPPEQPWRVTHTFMHGDAIVLKTVDGDVRYAIVENPDKWPATKNDADEGFGGEVRWVYDVKLEGGA